jgi:hypothetical protein
MNETTSPTTTDTTARMNVLRYISIRFSVSTTVL